MSNSPKNTGLFSSSEAYLLISPSAVKTFSLSQKAWNDVLVKSIIDKNTRTDATFPIAISLNTLIHRPHICIIRNKATDERTL